eukprot:2195295-Rhodomonas_salina.1
MPAMGRVAVRPEGESESRVCAARAAAVSIWTVSTEGVGPIATTGCGATCTRASDAREGG